MGRMIEFVREEINGVSIPIVKIDPGGSDNTRASMLQPPGEDTQPLPQDYGVAFKIPGMRRMVVVGWLDPVNEGTAGPGEKRLYSRASNGDIAATLFMKQTGKVTVAEGDTASDAPGLASKILSELQGIKSDIDVIKTHTHPSIPSGGGPVMASTELATGLTYDPQPVPSERMELDQ